MPIEPLRTRQKTQMQGEVAWISGSTGTIGRAVATALANEGATLIVSSRSDAALQAQAGDLASRYGVPTLAIPMDIGDRPQVESTAERIVQTYGRIDMLVNTTSLSIFGDFLELGDDDWLRVYQGKLFAYLRTIRAVLPTMLAQQNGRIVNLSGRGGHQPSMPVHLPGMTANAAVNLLTKGLANRYGNSGVRINAVAPGPVDSSRYEDMLKAKQAVSEKASHAATAAVGKIDEVSASASPSGLSSPEAVADVVLFLLSDRSRLMNGTVLQADSGSTASL